MLERYVNHVPKTTQSYVWLHGYPTCFSSVNSESFFVALTLI
nr:MAG TPA: hypothetical protein [Bacteriophage sp.]